MLFKVVNKRWSIPENAVNVAFLLTDDWDDFGCQTMFHLTIFDEEGNKQEIGVVRIALAGSKKWTILPKEFEQLDEMYYSLGNGENYYETLNQLPNLRPIILKGLCDCAFDLDRFERHINEQVMQASLLRSITAATVRERLHPLAHGRAELTEYNFIFRPVNNNHTVDVSPTYSFHVVPESSPPTNVHILIGRNGVGKTRLLEKLARAFLDDNVKNSGANFGTIDFLGNGMRTFAGLVFVSFSAFDEVEIERDKGKIPFYFIGYNAKIVELPEAKQAELNQTDSVPNRLLLLNSLKPADMAKVFVDIFRRCCEGIRAVRLVAALQILSSDPLFGEHEFDAKVYEPFNENWKGQMADKFLQLSSGHKIILLTITCLVETVDERTLVLIDEPECHLHPPLLSSLIRSVSDLLTNRNGVAIIATHSPVVLQEVPKSCVTIMHRVGNLTAVDKPTIETFGENVGTLTSEVFGLEVTDSGFHNLLSVAVGQGITYKNLLEKFGRQLGSEARAIAKALIVNRDGDSLR